MLGKSNDIDQTCPGYCELSRFDETLVFESVYAAELFELLSTESMQYSCQKKLAGCVKQILYGPVSEFIMFCRQIFTYLLEGYRSQRSIDEGLKWLVKAARRGATATQYDLAPVLHILDRPLPEGLPLRK